MARIHVKRVYDSVGQNDGCRVLVDRVWPRGISTERARVDVWMRSVAPSTALRKWFQHDATKWPEFKRRYFAELDQGPPDLGDLLGRSRRGVVTLIFSARDLQHNQAVALREYIETRGSS